MAAETSLVPASRYALMHWVMEDGLPLNKVRALVQTSEGYLWVGTFNGLARFDGVRFRVFDVGNTPALANNGIESLCADSRNRLWIGDNLGRMAVLEKGRFRAVALPAEWPTKPILRIVVSLTGTVWAINEDGWLLCLKEGAEGRVLKQRASPSLFTADREGEIWIIVRGLLCRLDDEKGLVPPEKGMRIEGNAQALFPAQKGGVWMLRDRRLQRWYEGAWVEEREKADWGTVVLGSFFEGRNGEIFGGSFKEGVSILRPDGRFERLNEATGLANNWAYCLLEDREGNVWVGTGNGGLHSFSDRRVTMVDTTDHWHSTAVLSVAPAQPEGLWIGTEGGGIYRLHEGVITDLRRSEQMWQSVVNSVLEDRHGRLWVGTWNSGLGYFDREEFRAAWPTRHAREVVLTVFESRRDDIWAGTRVGPGRLREGQWEWFEDTPALAGTVVRCFAEQPDGTIWCGLEGVGLCRIGEDRIQVFRGADGLPDTNVRTLFADNEGAMWIGTRKGLVRFKEGKFASVTTRHGLPSDVICQILDDQAGHLWIGSFGGIVRVAKEELDRCANGELNWVQCLVCDRSSGLATLEMSVQGQPSGCRTSDGRLWFATGKGLAMVQPADVQENLRPPEVLVEEVVVEGKVVGEGSHDSVVQISPGGGQLEFHYTGLSLTNPTRVGFRYRLVGIDADWTDAGARRAAFYPHLPPGSYVFEVMARNADGVWSQGAARLAVEVLPHFWQTWWFKTSLWLATMMGVGLVVHGVVRRRAYLRLETSERRRALEEERGRIARDIHDDLGGSLTRIVMLSDSSRETGEEAGAAGANLKEIGQTARQITLKISEIVWAVNPEHDTLDSLANFIGKFAHDAFAGVGIRCRLDIPLSLPSLVLPSNVRHNVFLAFKEALHNVAKHSGAAEVRVSLAFKDGQLVLQVEDDGCGFDPAALRPGSNGLRNLRHRLDVLGGRCVIDSAPGQGCRLRLVVPLTFHP